MSLNRITISGKLGSDPVLQETNSGVPVVNISLAVERDFKDAQTGERGVDWVDVVAYRHTADMVVKWFKKGDTMIVDGRLQVNPWTDKQGNKRRSTVVLANLVYFGSPKREKTDTASSPLPEGYQEMYGRQEEDGPLPF